MTTYLHLANGKSIVPAMHEAGVAGDIVTWDDVLHEGPVPEGLGPAALGDRRAEFLASCGWGPFDTIRRGLAARDTALEQATRGAMASPPGKAVDEVVLWLEHDLFDQLHRLQILDRVPLDGSPRITAVPDDEYLGRLPQERFNGLFAARREVTSAERLAARDAWTAFRASDPTRIVEVLPRVTVLRHMDAALQRHLEQFPSVANGLSRSEQQALEVIAGGATLASDVYVQSHHHRETAIFMGDAPFLVHLGVLLRPPAPLIAIERGARDLRLDDRMSLTGDGRAVLERGADRVRLCGIERWLGGVQLSGTGPVWRWDADLRRLRML